MALKHEREADGTSALVTVAARSEEEIARENEIKNLEVQSYLTLVNCPSYCTVLRNRKN